MTDLNFEGETAGLRRAVDLLGDMIAKDRQAVARFDTAVENEHRNRLTETLWAMKRAVGDWSVRGAIPEKK